MQLLFTLLSNHCTESVVLLILFVHALNVSYNNSTTFFHGTCSSMNVQLKFAGSVEDNSFGSDPKCVENRRINTIALAQIWCTCAPFESSWPLESQQYNLYR